MKLRLFPARGSLRDQDNLKVTMRIVKFVLALIFALVVLVVGSVYVIPERAVQTLRDFARDRAGLVRKELVLPDGLHYAYLEGGVGEPLMLLHGFGANKDAFVAAARFLTPKYHVIIPDHVGFAESSHPPAADYAPPAQAQRLRAFATALGIKQLHLGGSSMGGHIALTYAALYPTEVKSLWLLDPAGVWSAPKSDMMKIAEETGRNPLMVQSGEDFGRMAAFVMYKAPFIPGPVRDVLAQERNQNYALEQVIGKQLLADSVEQRVTGLTTPALIVWGANDRVISVASGDILKKLMPQSQLLVMPETGHAPMMERPAQSAMDYQHFRESLVNAK